jgi:hypothetical protein
MLEKYYAGAYWGARPEMASECAARALFFFKELRRIDPLWRQWYQAGKRPPGAPGNPANVYDEQELEELFRRGRNRTDVGKIVIEDLGFSIMVWTRERGDNTRVHIRCGAYTPFISNVCVATLPSEDAASERILTVTVLTQMLTCMAMAWDPEWAVATSDDVRDLVLQPQKKEHAVGWIMYCANRQGRVPPLPAPVRIERVQDKGTMITLSEERFTASNPEHVALTVRVHELLDRAGVLLPRSG